MTACSRAAIRGRLQQRGQDVGISNERAAEIIAEAAHSQRASAQRIQDALAGRMDDLRRLEEFIRDNTLNMKRSSDRAALRVVVKRAARRAQAAGTLTSDRTEAIIAAVNRTR
jgi:GTP cyclohydrolase FolE2